MLQRTVEQSVDEPVPQVMKGSVEVVQVAPQESVLERVVEQV